MTCDLTADPHALQGAAIRDLEVINVTARQQANGKRKGAEGSSALFFPDYCARLMVA